MNPISPGDLILALTCTLIVGFAAGAFCVIKLKKVMLPPAPSDVPNIVVNIPEGAEGLKQLTAPPEKIVGPDRAVIWWTVFDRLLDDENLTIDDILDAADRAVDKVYENRSMPLNAP